MKQIENKLCEKKKMLYIVYTSKNIILLFSIKYSYLSQIYRKCKAELN